VLKPSAFSKLLEGHNPKNFPRGKPGLGQLGHFKPSDIFNYELEQKMQNFPKDRDKKGLKKDPNSIFNDVIPPVTPGTYERLPTGKRLEYMEQQNQKKVVLRQKKEPLIPFHSDNYMGSVNSIIHCLFRNIALTDLLEDFNRGLVQRN